MFASSSANEAGSIVSKKANVRLRLSSVTTSLASCRTPVESSHKIIHLGIEQTNRHIRGQLKAIMENLRVYMLRASRTFIGSTAEVCEMIGNQIDSDLKETAH